MFESDSEGIAGNVASFDEDVAASDDADVRESLEPRFREIEHVTFAYASEIDSGIRAEIFGSVRGRGPVFLENVAPH